MTQQIRLDSQIKLRLGQNKNTFWYFLETLERKFLKKKKHFHDLNCCVSPGSDILFIFLRMDTSPFLLLTAITLQTGSCVSLWKAKFPPLWLLEVFDTGCSAVSPSPSPPDVQSSCGHPLYIPFFWVPLVLSKKMPHLSSRHPALSLWIFPLMPEWLQPFPMKAFVVVFTISLSLSLSPLSLLT